MPVLGAVGSVSSSSFGGGGATEELFDGPTDFYVVLNHGPGTVTQLTGSAVFASKDMYAATATNIPIGTSPHTNSSGIQALLGTGNISGNRYLWSDWANDVFDGWGTWYIYDDLDKTAAHIQFANVNGADGTIYEETASNSIYHGKDWRIRHGWVDQGIFRLDINCDDPNFIFSVGHWGNMGSDGSNQQFNFKSPGNVLAGSTNRTLHYLTNQQTSSSNEIFSLYCIPRVVAQNDSLGWNSSRFYGGIEGSDNLWMYVKSITHGVTFYYAKSLDQESAISADIVKSSVYTS